MILFLFDLGPGIRPPLTPLAPEQLVALEEAISKAKLR